MDSHRGIRCVATNSQNGDIWRRPSADTWSTRKMQFVFIVHVSRHASFCQGKAAWLILLSEALSVLLTPLDNKEKPSHWVSSGPQRMAGGSMWCPLGPHTSLCKDSSPLNNLRQTIDPSVDGKHWWWVGGFAVRGFALLSYLFLLESIIEKLFIMARTSFYVWLQYWHPRSVVFRIHVYFYWMPYPWFRHLTRLNKNIISFEFEVMQIIYLVKFQDF